MRFLYHEGKKRGKRILCKRGKNVSAMASLKWHNENMPLVAAPMQLEKMWRHCLVNQNKNPQPILVEDFCFKLFL